MDTAANMELDGSVLTATLLDNDGEPVGPRSIDLDERITNSDGQLMVCLASTYLHILKSKSATCKEGSRLIKVDSLYITPKKGESGDAGEVGVWRNYSRESNANQCVCI